MAVARRGLLVERAVLGIAVWAVLCVLQAAVVAARHRAHVYPMSDSFLRIESRCHRPTVCPIIFVSHILVHIQQVLLTYRITIVGMQCEIPAGYPHL